MTKRHLHIAVLLGLALILSCTRENPAPTFREGQICFTDEIEGTKADDPLHVGHNAVKFDQGTHIQVCIDYYKMDEDDQALTKYAYVHSAQFTKNGESNVFASPYSIVWLNNYYFDFYSVYPHDVYLTDQTFEETVYHFVPNVGYTHTPQYYQDEGNWYVTSGATIKTEGGAPAADPHDLITSLVLTRETAPNTKEITQGTTFIDHGEDPVKLTFMHRLSRLEPYFVNGMGDAEQVYLKGIAIYPTITTASFAVKRHIWWDKHEQDLFEYRDGSGWFHKTGETWADCVQIDDQGWQAYFDAAPLQYNLQTRFKLESSSAVMAKDHITELDGNDVEPFDPYVEFRMLPDSEIDCMILHFEIEGSDAYVPVHLNDAKNANGSFKTQMGHTTRLVLSYKATMITLLYVKYNEWESLPGRFMLGNLPID